jgi:hypothetical protein
MPDTPTPAEQLHAAAQRVRTSAPEIADSNLAWAISELLDDAADGDDQGEINPYALAVARAVLGGAS